MSMQRRCLSMLDVNRLRTWLDRLKSHQMVEPRIVLALEDKLACGRVCSPEQVPDDIVTMNSLVHVRNMRSGHVEQLKLVYPSDADSAAGKVSVASSLGIALLGSQICDLLEVEMPTGSRTYQVEEIAYRPEREKAYHL